MTTIAIIILYVITIGLAYIQGVRYRNTRFALRGQDRRTRDLHKQLSNLARNIDALRREIDYLKDEATNFRQVIRKIHIRLKRTETALGIEEGRENVRAENLRKTKTAGAGSPLPATFAPRTPRPAKKQS